MVQKFHAQRKWKVAAAMGVICKKTIETRSFHKKKPLGEWNPSAKRFQMSYLNLSIILSSQELFPLYFAQSSPMRWA